MKYKRLEEQKSIENKGDVLACKAYHLLFPEGRESISNDGIKDIDNKQWEIFWIQYETEKAYYGTPAEGLGYINCMILKEDIREFLQEEIEALEKNVYTLGEMISGKISQIQKVKINPIKSKWEKEKEEKPIMQEHCEWCGGELKGNYLDNECVKCGRSTDFK